MVDTDILDRVKQPASYLGCEIGAINKTPPEGGVHWALAFPDAYELGSTHTGFQIIYHVLNSHEHSAADRVFAPFEDFEKELLAKNLPLSSLEKDKPLYEFDVVGFSLSYELSYTNVLKILKLGRIPIRSVNRSGGDPIIVAGGLCTANPEPIAPFIDAFVIGDGEDAAVEVSEAIRKWKKSGESREELFDLLAAIDGVYVPVRSGAKKKISARRVANLDEAPFPTSMVVPAIEAIQDRVSIEIARGCHHACRFCQAGFLYRPLRERSASKIMELARQTLKNSGFSDLTLLSLSTGDYSCIIDMIKALAIDLKDKNIAINLPSLRAESICPEVIESIKSIRKTGFTIAPEAGSERLRRVINKNISDEQILETAKLIYSSGWKLIKLYFMFGLPTETEEDLNAIERLVRKIRKVGLDAGIRPNINVGLNAFVPKPHTPFQWEPMLNIDQIKSRLSYLKKRLQIPGVKLSWSDPRISFIEGVMSRGDRSLADAIERASDLGASFDGWGDRLQFEVWQRAFQETGVNAEAMASDPRPLNEKLPWDAVDIGASKIFLVKEKEKSFNAVYSSGCGEVPCVEKCGGCDSKVKAVRSNDKAPVSEPAAKISTKNIHRYRIFYRKVGPARFLGHLDTARAFHQTLRRAEFTLIYSEGFHPMPRTRFGAPLSLGVASLAELFDVDFPICHEPAEIIDRLNRALPRGLNVHKVYEIDKKEPSPQEAVESIRYRFEVPEGGVGDPYSRIDKVRIFNDSTKFPIEIDNNGKKRKFDLKDYVTDIIIYVGAAVEIELKCNENGATPRAGAIWEALFGKLPPYARIIKTETRLKNAR